MPGEFDIINQYFRFSSKNPSVLLGVGDDAAVVQTSRATSSSGKSATCPSARIVVATDTLVEGVHFPKDMAAAHVASRALLVNISDFAAMGVRPQWYTMALSLPEVNESWLAEFSSSLSRLSEQHALALVGGDTVKGPLSITLTLMGEAKTKVLTRRDAKTGDDVWVSNSLGRGGAALKLLQGSASVEPESGMISAEENKRLRQHFYAPDSLVDFGVSLVEFANAAIDISDGLLADAKHIADQSGVALVIDWCRIPADEAALKMDEQAEIHRWLLTHGDEYQLLFTAPEENRQEIEKLGVELGVACSRIGEVIEGAGVQLTGLKQAAVAEASIQGFQHFR